MKTSKPVKKIILQESIFDENIIKNLCAIDYRLGSEGKNFDIDYEKAKQRLSCISAGQDIEERKLYAKKTFRLVSASVLFVFLILFVQGFQYKNFNLSDKVLITLLSTTIIEIIGLFCFVMKYLFSNGNKE